MKEKEWLQLQSLFFATRQIIREQIPIEGLADGSSWLHFETLKFVDKEANPTMQELASFLRVKAPSATSLVSTLVKAGMLRRVPAPEDKRLVKIMLAEAGKAFLAKKSSSSASMMRSVFSKLSQGELSRLVSILSKVRDGHMEKKDSSA